MSGYALGGHVVGGTDEGVGVALGAEFTADAKVAEFDLPVAAQENVGGFDVCERGLVLVGRQGVDIVLPRWMIFWPWRYVRPFKTPSATFPSTFSPVRPPSFLTSR